MKETSNTVFSSAHAHFVFVTRYRHRVFDAQAIGVLRDIFVDVCSDEDAMLVEMDGEHD